MHGIVWVDRTNESIWDCSFSVCLKSGETRHHWLGTDPSVLQRDAIVGQVDTSRNTTDPSAVCLIMGVCKQV